MKHYTYLIVGGGMAADAAVKGIRKEDPAGSIGLLTCEPHPPYPRPPLSKDAWLKHLSLDAIDCGTASENLDILTGRTVKSLDRKKKTVYDQDRAYQYEKLLLAPGGTPRRLSFAPSDRAVYYRTKEDLRTIRKLAETVDHFAVIGGSFIGCEMTAALLSAGKKVTMIFPEKAPFRRLFPKTVSRELLELFKYRGAEVIPGVKLSDLNCGDEQCRLTLENGRNLSAGAAIIGIGIEPNIGLAEGAGLETEKGIVVNRELQTNDADIYAAGDVIRFYNPALKRTIRVEHEDHALMSGEAAGRNMAGQTLQYDHLPFFYSSLFDTSCEAVGVLDSSLEIEGIWNGIQGKGLWAYLDKRRVCGVLLWNLPGQIDLARALIAEPEPLSAQELNLRLGTFLTENSD